MSSPHEQEKAVPPGHLVVTVHDEDRGGAPITIDDGPGERVSKVVAELYTKLGYNPEASDRIVCLATGEDVRQYGEMHLREYAAGKCGDLVWTFARSTGGAGV